MPATDVRVDFKKKILKQKMVSEQGKARKRKVKKEKDQNRKT